MLERRRSYLRRALAAGALLAPLGIIPLSLIELVWVIVGGSGLGSLADTALFAAATFCVPMGVFVLVGLLIGPLMLAVALLAQRLADQRLKEPPWIAKIYAIASTPAVAYFIRLALAGRRARQLPARWLIVLAFGAFGVAGVYVAVRAIVGARDRFRIRRWGKGMAVLLSLLLCGGAAGFYAMDQRVLVGLYGFVHVALALAAAACSELAVAALYAAWRPVSRRLGRLLRPRLALVVGVVLITAGSMTAHAVARNELLRFVVFERTAFQRKLMGLADAAGIVRTPRPDIAPRREDALPADLPDGPRVRDANIVLITIDALRADRLNVYGARREVTPALDNWARGAVVFRGYCSIPITSFSVTALITGCRMNRSDRRIQQTLPTMLRRYGYKTGGFFPPSIFYIDEKRFERFETTHFDFEYVKYEYLDARGRVDQVLDFLHRYGQGKFFVWAHFFEPHHPYVPHANLHFGDQALDRYDGEVAYVDRQLARLLKVLRTQYPNTIIALTSDHGEAFGEHGMHYHGSSLYEEQIRVPLILSVPGIGARRVDGPAQNIDLPVTLLRLVDIPVPPQMEGQDLGPWIGGAPGDKLPPAFAELRQKGAIVEGRYKLIYDMARNFSELYDLKRDPAERTNLVAAAPTIARRLRGRLLEWLNPPRVARVDPAAHIRALLDRARQGDSGTVLELVRLYRRGDAVLRREAILQLVHLRAQSSRDVLSEAAHAQDPGVAIAATIGAALLGDEESLSRVAPLLQRPDLPPDLRLAALIALARQKKDRSVTRELSARLRASTDIYERFEIIEALGASGDRSATPALRQQLGTLRTRLRAINALGSVGAVAAVPDLIRALEGDPFVNWRQHAAYALGSIGDVRAVAALARAVRKEREAAVVGAAVWALWRLRSLPVKGLRPLSYDGPWRCEAGRCVLRLGVACRAGRELLLLADPPAAPLEVRCGDSVRAVMQTDVSDALASVDALSLPVVVAPLDGSRADLEIISRGKARLRYAGLRRSPASALRPAKTER